MSAKSSLSLLERQVDLPERRRLWFFAFCCVAAAMVGAAGAVVHSLRSAHVIVIEAGPTERGSANHSGQASACPTTTMTAALTREEWLSVTNADAPGLSKSARIVPSIKDGKANGFKLYAIGPESIWARIGLENGDTLQRVQGMEMNSPDQALALYSQLEQQVLTEVNVDLTRDGCPATLQVNLLD